MMCGLFASERLASEHMSGLWWCRMPHLVVQFCYRPACINEVGLQLSVNTSRICGASPRTTILHETHVNTHRPLALRTPTFLYKQQCFSINGLSSQCTYIRHM